MTCSSGHLLVCSVEGVGIVRLGTDHTGHPVDETHVHAHLEALVEGVDVAQVAARDDNPIGHFPVKLLADLYGCCLLTLQPQTAQEEGCLSDMQFVQQVVLQLEALQSDPCFPGCCQE